MKIDVLDLHCLNSACDDYESVATVIEDIRRETHFKVNEGGLIASIQKLHSLGFLEVFDYDVKKTAFVPAIPQGNVLKQWFFISDEGRRVLDEYWVDDPEAV